MKNIIMAATIVCVACLANAAAVGWTNAGLTNFKGNAYNIFVIGQNGVSDIATITALLDAGSDISSYAFGGGFVNTSGAANQLATVAGAPTLDAGTYTSFTVLFDSATPTSGESKYVVISGMSGQTIEIASTTASKVFAAGNVSSIANNASNWSSFGSSSVPEPTSGLLLLLGMAGLALKRKVA